MKNLLETCLYEVSYNVQLCLGCEGSMLLMMNAILQRC